MTDPATILVVDDEHGIRESLRILLEDDYNVLLCAGGKEAVDVFMETSVDLILLDIRLPDINGVDLLVKLKEINPTTEIIIITAVRELQTAIKAVRLGAYEYVVRPFVIEDVLTLITRALEKGRLIKEVAYLKTELKRSRPFEKMVGEHPKMKAIFELISTIATSNGAALIQGETGTGKELVARAIHNLGPRKGRPFVVINCAAIPMNLMESELFGYSRGAFTGANQTTIGKIELADNGTVFLDDVNTLDMHMQAKLLRVIQEREIQRLGDSKTLKVDIRFIAASNQDLSTAVTQSKFKEDLFYRLNIFPVHIPPLRDRQTDIPLLLTHFLQKYSAKRGEPMKSFSPKAIKELIAYDWPSNVRELENLVERLATITKGPVIELLDQFSSRTDLQAFNKMPLKEATNSFQKQHITDVLNSVGGSRKKAAEILGIHRNTLLTKISELGISA